MEDYKPTPEQQAIVAAFVARKDIVVEAGAGTGKTSTLELMAAATPSRKGMYLAYNAAIAKEAKAKFPKNVQCGTAHSYAMRAVGRRYAHRLQGGQRMPAWRTAKALGINEHVRVGERLIDINALARLTMQMVARFCSSADREITTGHVPFVEGLEAAEYGHRRGPAHRVVAAALLPYARKAWADLNKTDGVLRFQHDHYLKMWQLTNPVLDVDFILFDEAQDADPVIASIVGRQTHTQRVFVGDRAQAIYEWRGAIDAMGIFADQPGVEVLYLSQSFRFGPAIAGEANRFLGQLDTPLRIKGTPMIVSTVGACETPDAVLCRTNGGALKVALEAQEAGTPVHLVGGGSQMAAFIRGAKEMIDTGATGYPELTLFASWSQVEEYVDADPEGSDLAVLVRLVNEYGCDTLLEVLDGAVTEAKATLTVSTAHKAKGREWERVRIAEDFEAKTRKNADGEQEARPPSPEELRLRYVAVTRARKVLDPGPLAEDHQESSTRPMVLHTRAV